MTKKSKQSFNLDPEVRNFLDENISELYRTYIKAYGMAAPYRDTMIPGNVDRSSIKDNVLVDLAILLGTRGGKNNWAVFTAAEFKNKITEMAAIP